RRQETGRRDGDLRAPRNLPPKGREGRVPGPAPASSLIEARGSRRRSVQRLAQARPRAAAASSPRSVRTPCQQKSSPDTKPTRVEGESRWRQNAASLSRKRE